MIYIGSDHAGFELKNEIYEFVRDELKMDIEDLGCHTKESVDYPDYAKIVCEKVLKNNGIGILICGSGLGISISANKIKGIRCALCSEEYSASMARKHNNANALALGGRVIGAELAKSVVKVFLNTDFEGKNCERHQIRVDKIMALEK